MTTSDDILAKYAKYRSSTPTQQKKGGGGGGVGSDILGGLGKVFDVLSRPLYGVANTVDYTTRGKNPLEGLASGVWGTEKTTFKKVLNDAGVKGPVSDVGGLALDIVADPTTYVGLGAAKSAGIHALETAAGKSVAEHILEGGAKKVGEEALVKAAQDTGKDFVKIGGKKISVGAKEATMTSMSQGQLTNLLQGITSTGKTLGEKEGQSIAAEAVRKSLKDVSDKALEKEAEKAAKGSLYLRVGKKKIGVGSPVGEKGYEVLSKAGQAARANPAIAGVEKAFRPAATFVGKTHDLSRRYFGGAQAEAKNFTQRFANGVAEVVDKNSGQVIRDAMPGLKDLTSEEAKRIPYIIEHGGANPTFGNRVASKTGIKMDEYLKTFMYHQDELRNAEKGLGESLGIQIAGKDDLQNFVHHFYQGGEKADIEAFKKLRKKVQAIPKDAKGNVVGEALGVKSLDEAKALGLKPVEDARDILALAAQKSYGRQGSARYVTSVADEYGIKGLGEGADLGQAGKLSPKQLDKQLKDVGLVRSKHKYANGAYFTPDIENTLQKVQKYATDPAAGGELAKLYDDILGKVKFMYTAPNPGHHVRNAMGDIWNNFLGGVVRARPYLDSEKVLAHVHENPNIITLKGVDGFDKSGADLYNSFIAKGGQPGFQAVETAANEVGSQGVIREATGKTGDIAHGVLQKIHHASEKREEWGRFANFLDYMQTHAGELKTHADWERLTNEAAARTRKYGIDYADLTAMERNVMKRVVPFYTWQRKNIPLQLESILTHPGKVVGLSKAINGAKALAGDMGVGTSADSAPAWLRLAGGIPISDSGDKGTFLSPSGIPTMDLGQYTQGGVSGIAGNLLSQLTPFAKVPIETATGRTIGGAGVPTGPLQSLVNNFEPPLAKTGAKLATGVAPGMENFGAYNGGMTPADWARFFGISVYQPANTGKKTGTTTGAGKLTPAQIKKILGK